MGPTVFAFFASTSNVILFYLFRENVVLSPVFVSSPSFAFSFFLSLFPFSFSFVFFYFSFSLFPFSRPWWKGGDVHNGVDLTINVGKKRMANHVSRSQIAFGTHAIYAAASPLPPVIAIILFFCYISICHLFSATLVFLYVGPAC